MATNEEILYESMRKSTPVLLLGAGFSLGSVNGKGEKLVLSNELAEIVYTNFFVKNRPMNISKEMADATKEYSHDLKYICSLLNTLGLKKERNDFLTEFFKECSPGLDDHFHERFTLYHWNKIFTLNIDDLVENIYRVQGLEYDVIDQGSADPGRENGAQPKIIKLHGNVSNPTLGYIFDDMEYAKFTADQSPILRLFGQFFSSNDVIILGSEFQETDLSIINEIYQATGNDLSHKYFFVGPKISDLLLRTKIENTANFYYIPWKTSEFINNIYTYVVPFTSDNKLLLDLGVIFPYNSFHENPKYLSELYSGKIPRYDDFLNVPNWDIAYPGLSEKVLLETQKGKDIIIPLYGHQYCGKTCQLMRLLVNMERYGFVIFELKQCSVRILQEVIDYLKSLPDGTKVAIACDNAASHYRVLVDFILGKPTNISQLVIYTADTVENHRGKRHYLREAGFEKEYWIKEELSPTFSRNIFEQLDRHNRLGMYQKLIPTGTKTMSGDVKNRIINKINHFNDIIDALYYASEGISFKKYYEKFARDHEKNEYWKYICIISMMDSIGLSKIPKYFINRLIPSATTFSFGDFTKTYTDILQVEHGYVHVRGSQILLYSMHKDSKALANSLYQLVVQTLGLFTETDKNEYSDIFEKALRVKRLQDSKLINKKEIFGLFSKLESTKANLYSYFWIQYGIASQRKYRYDEANNHFLKAQTIRNSYSVQHALALNKLEKGYYQYIRHEPDADEIFLQGQQEMEELILTLNSPRTYSYSVHSYVNMLLKYYNKKRNIIPDETLEKMSSYIQSVLESPLDSRMNKKISDFISYCRLHHKEKYIDDIKKVHRKVAIQLSEDDYDEILYQ